MDIVVVGDINVDLIFTGLPSLPAYKELKYAKDVKLTMGGSSSIFACNVARLGAKTGFIGKVGKDHLGDFLIDTLHSAGVDTSRMVRASGMPTGICASMSFPQDYALVSYPGIRESFQLKEIDLDYVQQASHLHLSGFYLQPGLQPDCVELFRRAKGAGLRTSLDPDHDAREKWDGGIKELLPHVDFFLPNETEAARISRASDLSTVTSFFGRFGGTTVIKQGASGACVVRGQEILSAPAFHIDPVDTTGAGDSFNAGFVFQVLRRAALGHCMTWGNACGALSTRALGGIDGFPTMEEVEAFLMQQTERPAVPLTQPMPR
jgi:sugar/nucleoside kinase (ribokinase family)